MTLRFPGLMKPREQFVIVKNDRTKSGIRLLFYKGGYMGGAVFTEFPENAHVFRSKAEALGELGTLGSVGRTCRIVRWAKGGVTQ